MKRKRGEDIRDWIQGDFRFKDTHVSVKSTKQMKITDIYPDLVFKFKVKKNDVKKLRQRTLEEFCGNSDHEKIPVKIIGRQLFFFPEKTGKAWFKVSDKKVTSVVTEGFLEDAGRCGWSVVQYADGLLFRKEETKFIVFMNDKKDKALIELLP